MKMYSLLHYDIIYFCIICFGSLFHVIEAAVTVSRFRAVYQSSSALADLCFQRSSIRCCHSTPCKSWLLGAHMVLCNAVQNKQLRLSVMDN